MRRGMVVQSAGEGSRGGTGFVQGECMAAISMTLGYAGQDRSIRSAKHLVGVVLHESEGTTQRENKGSLILNLMPVCY